MDMKTSPLALLADPSLLKTDALIDGQWVAGSFTSKRAAPATHWPSIRASVLSRLGSA
ncbi:MAG: succinate-semialdehyde dehydrogenase (NADP(+)), partial [Comamonadaceae bacterium]